MRLKPALSYTEHIARARHFANALLPSSQPTDKSNQEKKRNSDGRSDPQGAKESERKKSQDSGRRNHDERLRDHDQARGGGREQDRSQRRVGGAYPTYHPFTETIKEIYIATQNREQYQPPRPLCTDPPKRNPNKYCRYYREHGHNTNDYWDLKDEVEALIQRGRL